MLKVPLIHKFQKGAKGKRYMIKILFLLVVGCIFGGCTTAIRTQQIDIKSSTEGSKIAIYDKYNNKVRESSVSTADLEIRRQAGLPPLPVSTTAYLDIGNTRNGGGVYLVEITKDGYEPLTTLIGPDFNTSGGILWGTWWTMGNMSPRIINADLDEGVITVFNRSDWYSGIGYGIPWLGGTPQWGEIAFNSGRIWRNGVFCGSASNFGFGYSESRDGERYRWTAGIGFDVGGVYDLSVDGLQFVYGGGIGFWHAGDYQERNNYNEIRLNFNYLAPFVKLRYKSFELSYRGLLGVSEKERRHEYYDNRYYYDEYYDRYYGGYDYDYEYDSKFGWNNHQLTLGLYFEGSKRKGVTLQRR